VRKREREKESRKQSEEGREDEIKLGKTKKKAEYVFSVHQIHIT
jgi:hypothetical protein